MPSCAMRYCKLPVWSMFGRFLHVVSVCRTVLVIGILAKSMKQAHRFAQPYSKARVRAKLKCTYCSMRRIILQETLPSYSIQNTYIECGTYTHLSRWYKHQYQYLNFWTCSVPYAKTCAALIKPNAWFGRLVL